MSQIMEANLIAAIVVAVTDLIAYLHLKNNPEHLTLPFVILAIIVTVVPIWINIWFHLEVSLIMRASIITAIVVTVTDLVEYLHLKNNPEHLTLPYVILVIIVTVVPIWINIWFHLRTP